MGLVPLHNTCQRTHERNATRKLVLISGNRKPSHFKERQTQDFCDRLAETCMQMRGNLQVPETTSLSIWKHGFKSLCLKNGHIVLFKMATQYIYCMFYIKDNKYLYSIEDYLVLCSQQHEKLYQQCTIYNVNPFYVYIYVMFFSYCNLYWELWEGCELIWFRHFLTLFM